ncbi:LysR family transcriptional regulator [Sorangium sp. So ce406]|uniref:LysR family transcriptional regulator n=1 Tax=Sorangium sp. So ce406 TaxID=3133311 RepID=UPI003F5AE3C3
MDAFTEIGVFVRVVDARSFTRAGRMVGLTASGVSRVVTRLESRLGVRLLERTTRSVGLTAEGAAYYERCARILRDLEDADGALARGRGAPRGRLRVDAPTVLGRFVLGPSIPRFLDACPEVSLELSLRDHVIDPIAEGVDVVLRMAHLRESELVHKKLGTARFLVVASPAYLARRGRPSAPADLRRHDTLGFLAGAAPLPWRLRSHGRDIVFSPSGRLHTNSVDAIRHAAVAGHGLAQLLELHVREELDGGALEVVLSAHEHREVPIHALYTRDKASLPKVRAFLDFIAECLSATPGGAKAAPSSAKAVAPGARSLPATSRTARRRGEPTSRAAR